MPEFDEQGAARVVAATRWVEDRYRNAVPRGERSSPTTYAKFGLVTVAITARVHGTPGRGYAQPYMYDGDLDELAAVADVPEEIRNWTGSTAAVGALIVYSSRDGYLFWDGNDCSGAAFP